MKKKMKILFSILEMFRCLNFFLDFCLIASMSHYSFNLSKKMQSKKISTSHEKASQFKIEAEKTPR